MTKRKQQKEEEEERGPDKSYSYYSDEIDNEIRKRKGKWRLSSINWLDYDDVSQIIRFHIFKKWDQWDQRRPLLPWINKIISNQLKNLIRNHYHSFVKPCVGCPFNNSNSDQENYCDFTPTKKQDSNCPLFKKWSKSKKHAYGVKIPVSIETLPRSNIEDHHAHNTNVTISIEKVNKELKKILPEKQYYIYKMLFMDKKPEEEIAIELGYKTNEKGRTAGYKQIKNLKLKFKKIVLKMIKNKDII